MTQTPEQKFTIKQPDFAWLSPSIVITKPKETLDFYQNILGFTLEMTMLDENNELAFAKLSKEDSTLMVTSEKTAFSKQTENNPPIHKIPGGGVAFYLYHDDVDGAYKKAIDAGCKSISEPFDTFWGDRSAEFLDPEGYIWALGKQTHNFDPSKLPEGWHPGELK